VWRDTADLWPGEDWRAKIRRAITGNALVFIACFSSRSVARVKSYQNEELLLAIEELRLRRPDEPWLIPVRFDNCAIPDRDLGAGRTLGSIQRADLFGERRDTAILRLVGTVLRLLNQQSHEAREAEKEIVVRAYEPYTFSAVITSDLVRFVLPLGFHNPGAFPVVIQSLRMRFLDEHDSPPLPWVTTRSHVGPQRDDWEFPAVFSIAGGATHRIFAEFGAPALQFRLKACDYPIAVEAKLGHKEDWHTILQFGLRAGRIVEPDHYITYENSPDGLSEEQRRDVQIGLDFAQMGAGKAGGGAAKLPTVGEQESGT